MTTTQISLTPAQGRAINSKIELSNGHDIINDIEPRVVRYQIEQHVCRSVYVFLLDADGRTVESFLVTEDGDI